TAALNGRRGLCSHPCKRVAFSLLREDGASRSCGCGCDSPPLLMTLRNYPPAEVFYYWGMRSEVERNVGSAMTSLVQQEILRGGNCNHAKASLIAGAVF